MKAVQAGKEAKASKENKTNNNNNQSEVDNNGKREKSWSPEGSGEHDEEKSGNDNERLRPGPEAAKEDKVLHNGNPRTSQASLSLFPKQRRKDKGQQSM